MIEFNVADHADWERLPFYYVYDWENYPNFSCLTVRHIYSQSRWIFEFSDTWNHSAQLYSFLMQLRHFDCTTVGFNNIAYDYPILHFFIETYLKNGFVTYADLYAKSQSIFAMQDDRFGAIIWDNQRHIKQLDLLKVHHFDNKAKRTGLKVLEFNMRSYNIADLPFPPGTVLTRPQQLVTIEYNCHDVDETMRFFLHSKERIRFRENLTAKYGIDFMNHNDTKVGKDYFIREIEKSLPGSCYIPGTKKPRQTPRDRIPLDEVIFPYVAFQTPEFNRVLEYLRNTVLTTTNKPPELKDLSATIRGFQFDFGAGGLHGSVSARVARSDAEHDVVDADVTSFYPKLAIENGVYPEHLGAKFCDVYLDFFNQRQATPKKTPENEMMKLGLNGVYGDSNNEYGPFLDPKYTMAITINGQLSLAMFAERCIQVPGIEILQANTDGITVRMHKSCRPIYDKICEEWQKLTRLGLEFAEYDSMFIRDVNNYIAVQQGGKKIKRIGAYMTETAAENPGTRELGWNKDWSGIVIPKAAVASMVTGARVEDLVWKHSDPYDFMMRAKAPRGSRLVASYSNGDMPLQNTTRYYLANQGPSLVKVMPPLKGKDTERRIGINVKWQVKICDHVKDWSWHDLNREFYIEEAKKLVVHG